MHNNYIAGEWVASKEAVENRNPSDISDLAGDRPRGTADGADEDRQRAD